MAITAVPRVWDRDVVRSELGARVVMRQVGPRNSWLFREYVAGLQDAQFRLGLVADATGITNPVALPSWAGQCVRIRAADNVNVQKRYPKSKNLNRPVLTAKEDAKACSKFSSPRTAPAALN